MPDYCITDVIPRLQPTGPNMVIPSKTGRLCWFDQAEEEINRLRQALSEIMDIDDKELELLRTTRIVRDALAVNATQE